MKDTDRLLEYLRGDRRGKTANRLEREALSDPFLYEALEGLENLEEDGMKVKERLSRSVRRCIRPSHYFPPYRWMIAGSIVLLFLGGWSGWRMLKKTAEVEKNGLSSFVSLPQETVDTVIGQVVPSVNARAGQGAGKEEVISSSVKNPVPEHSAILSGQTEDAGFSEKEENAIRIKVQNPDSVASLPVGGIEAYNRYIRRSLVYPEDALQEHLQGEIQLSFIVNKHGRPSRIRVVKWINHSCNHEAIRLLDEGPAWVYTGSTEPTFLTVPFRLPVSR